MLDRWFWLSVVVLGVLLVFVTPLWFPPRVPAFYSAYTVGFNNRLATLSAMGLSVLVAAILFVKQRVPALRRIGARQHLSAWWLFAACALACLYTIWFGWLMVRSGSSSADVDYIMIPLQEVAYEHGQIYRNAEFAYGPFLFDLPRGMQWLLGHLAGARPVVGYLAADLVSQWMGVGVLFYVVQQLPMRRIWKGIAFSTMVLASLRPALGLNYTMLRFCAPYAFLLLVAKVNGRWWRAIVALLSQAVALALSPEMGVAFGVGIMVFMAWKVWRGHRDVLWLLPALLVGASSFALLVDRNYFHVFAHFASGMLNMVVTPVPHTLLLLTATLALAPITVASWCRMPGQNAPTAAGYFAIALVLLSPALGLCDELHTFFDGAGMFLLSFVAASELAGVGVVWGVVLLCLAVGSPAMDSLEVARAEWRTPSSSPASVVAIKDALGKLPGTGLVYAPAGAPQPVRDLLMAEGRWSPSYFSGLNNAVDPSADERKVAEMRHATYVLLPKLLGRPGPDNRRRMRWLRFGYTYVDRYRGFMPLTAVRADLVRNFQEIATISEGAHQWDLYRRIANTVPN